MTEFWGFASVGMTEFGCFAPVGMTEFLWADLSGASQDQGYVVGLFVGADPVVDGSGHNFGNARKRQVAILAQQVDQPLLTEFAKVIFRFGYAVGVANEYFATPELHRILFIASFIEQADHGSAAFQAANRTVFAQDDGWQMSSIAVGELALCAVVDPKEQRRILFGRRAFVELMIQQGEQSAGGNVEREECRSQEDLGTERRADGRGFAKDRNVLHAEGAHGGVDGRHQQRGRDSFAADIADSQDQPIRVQGEEIVVVAAYGARRAEEPVNFERRELNACTGKQLCLDFLSDDQLVFQSLFVLLFFDQLFQRSSHRVKRVCQSGDLVVGPHRNAMAEVAAIDKLGAFVKLGYRSGHSAGQARADYDCDNFDQPEDHSHDQESPFDGGRDVSQRIKEAVVEFGHTRLYGDQDGVKPVARVPIHHRHRSPKGDLAIQTARRRGNGSCDVGGDCLSCIQDVGPLFAEIEPEGLLAGLARVATILGCSGWRRQIHLAKSDPGVQCDFAQVGCQVLQQVLVQRLTGKHGQTPVAYRDRLSRAEKEFVMVTNHFAK